MQFLQEHSLIMGSVTLTAAITMVSLKQQRTES